uniref:uncharacterized protein LOC120812523 isoform X1 n=1 Tax=Gasterosteus aculeatus aculeatus TaxID=481459 RepID=UPI001A9818FC|nr:uncharacterized protein LOC120812523 isoform X1 [Gasterosteus aculeatus aculeatus]
MCYSPPPPTHSFWTHPLLLLLLLLLLVPLLLLCTRILCKMQAAYRMEQAAETDIVSEISGTQGGWTPPTSPSPPALMVHTPPQTPPPGPTATQEKKEEKKLCEPHEVFKDTARFLEYLRIGVLHLLNKVWVKYNIEICYGCQTNNPSQKNHLCLYPCDWFYELHFDPLMKRLWNDNFISAILLFMDMNDLQVDADRIQGGAEVLLDELKSGGNAAESIQKMYDTLIGEDELKMNQLKKLGRLWGEVSNPYEAWEVPDDDDDDDATDIDV